MKDNILLNIFIFFILVSDQQFKKHFKIRVPRKKK